MEERNMTIRNIGCDLTSRVGQGEFAAGTNLHIPEKERSKKAGEYATKILWKKNQQQT